MLYDIVSVGTDNSAVVLVVFIALVWCRFVVEVLGGVAEQLPHR